MQRLKRVFPSDLERRPQCDGRGRIFASIDAPEVIHTTLSLLVEPDRRRHRARAPPSERYRRPRRTRRLGLAHRFPTPLTECGPSPPRASLTEPRPPSSAHPHFPHSSPPHGGSEIPAPDPSNRLEPNAEIRCRLPGSMGYFPYSQRCLHPALWHPHHGRVSICDDANPARSSGPMPPSTPNPLLATPRDDREVERLALAAGGL